MAAFAKETLSNPFGIVLDNYDDFGKCIACGAQAISIPRSPFLFGRTITESFKSSPDQAPEGCYSSGPFIEKCLVCQRSTGPRLEGVPNVRVIATFAHEYHKNHYKRNNLRSFNITYPPCGKCGDNDHPHNQCPEWLRLYEEFEAALEEQYGKCDAKRLYYSVISVIWKLYRTTGQILPAALQLSVDDFALAVQNIDGDESFKQKFLEVALRDLRNNGRRIGNDIYELTKPFMYDGLYSSYCRHFKVQEKFFHELLISHGTSMQNISVNSPVCVTRDEMMTVCRRAAQSVGLADVTPVFNSFAASGRSVNNGNYEFDGWSAYSNAKKHAHDGTAERKVLDGTGFSPSELLAKAVASAKADLQRQRADHFWIANGKKMDEGHSFFSQMTSKTSDYDIAQLEKSMNIKVISCKGVPEAHSPYTGNAVEGALAHAINCRENPAAFQKAVSHLESVSNVKVTGMGTSSFGGSSSNSGSSSSSSTSSGGGGGGIFDNIVIY